MNKIYAIISYSLIVGNLISQTTHTVNAGSYYYNPATLNIVVGDSVVWINDGGYHDVNGDTNSITNQPFNNPETFDSPAASITGGVIFAHKFTIPGTYNYDCSVGSHAVNGMVGSVVVSCEDTITNFLTIAECEADSYIWDGETYTASGSYSNTYQNANGCDSIVTLDLTFNDPYDGV